MEVGETLQSLFDAKVMAVLKLFIKEEGKQLYLREIAKLSKVSPASTYRILKRLAGLQIIRLTELKTAKLYSLESNKTVEMLKSLVEVDTLQHFCELASLVSGVEEILLLAKEKTKANLLILGNNIDTGELKRLCADIKEKHSFSINLMSLSREQYEQMSAMGLYPGGKKSLYRRS